MFRLKGGRLRLASLARVLTFLGPRPSPLLVITRLAIVPPSLPHPTMAPSSPPPSPTTKQFSSTYNAEDDMPPSLPSSYQRITLLRRPRAAIDQDLSGSGTFGLEANIPLKPDQLKEDEILVAVEWLSLDPAMRGAWSTSTSARRRRRPRSSCFGFQPAAASQLYC